MNIILVTQIPPYYQQFRSNQHILPDFQAQTHWQRALEALGHQVSVFKYSDPIVGSAKFWAGISCQTSQLTPRIYSKFRLIRNRNYQYFPDNYFRSRNMISLIQQIQPELIIFSGGISELDGSALKYAQHRQVPVILLHGVHPNLGATQYEKDHVSIFEHIFTNDPVHSKKWLKLGARASTAIPYSGIDVEFHNQVAVKKDIQLIFIGSLFKERQELFVRLIQRGLPLDIYGLIPKKLGLYNQLKPFYKGEAWGTKMVNLFSRAKIALNLLPTHMPVGGNLRTFEIPATKALQVTDRCPKEWYKPGKEIIIYASFNDLVKQLRYYLSHDKEREDIARNAYIRTLRSYTYEKRFKQMINIVFEHET